jgi:hypothetical protein
VGGGEYSRRNALFGADALWAQIMLIDPGQFRVLNELLEAETKGRGRMESMGYAAVTTEEKLE